MKKKIEHVQYGITKNEANYQITMIELMNKLLEQSRQNNSLLRRLFNQPQRRISLTPYETSIKGSSQNMRKNLTGVIFYPKQKTNLLNYNSKNENYPLEMKTQKDQSQEKSPNQPLKQSVQAQNEVQEDDFKKLMRGFHQGLMEATEVNKKIYEKLDLLNRGNQNALTNMISEGMVSNNEPGQRIQQTLMQILERKQKGEKKTYGNYGIISQIMPFSDKREIKIRYKIIDLLDQNQLSHNLNMKQFKQKTTQWVGMVFRATASICWNMLIGGQLNFQQIKVLFTQNIIFNFIQFMKDIDFFANEQKKLELTNHINQISCEVLQFLCRQYPQTKVQAPNIALRKAIPLIQNQGQSKFDLITMVCKTFYKLQDKQDSIQFNVREDKDYSRTVMKIINFMIDRTDSQFSYFQKIMTNIFQKMYLPKQKRMKLKGHQAYNSGSHEGGVESQYREKVKSYSSYAIGRKIPKNTPKYSKNQIQYGVFYVKAPSILRIITKWFEELWQFVNTPLQKLKNTTQQIKDHEGNVLNISSRVKHLLYQKVNERLMKIKTKIQRIKTQCYNMQFLLSGTTYTSDSQQIHLSLDQLSVGKYCSNLKNAISSYVEAQLSKIIYYLLLIPLQIDQKVLDFNDEDFQQQARKHLDKTNLVTLRIFDLLRCKCHSNQEEIIYIVEALKQLERDDEKFEIVRVKDRLNQGTRDILINAQYDNGLVWEIQLAVTSHADKKQDLLDKYNHFLYQLKRSKLGPISESVSIWSSLEQRSIYFQQLNLKKATKTNKMSTFHKGKACNQDNLESFSQFKRPIICNNCKEYFSVPRTSLLNVRCQNCRVTLCGSCYYYSLDDLQKKRFMFRNFDKKKLLNSSAFQQLQQYNDIKKPIPSEGFFIKKYFLNRELSYYTLVKIDQCAQNQNEYLVSVSQTVIRKGEVIIRGVNKKQISVIIKDGRYYSKNNLKQLSQIWVFSFKNKATQKISIDQLQVQLKDTKNIKMKYLNVLSQPNYMNQMKLYSKIFEKVRLLTNIRSVKDIQKYQISVYRFPNLTILAKLNIDQKQLQQLLIKKANQSALKSFAQKKISIINMQGSDLTTQIFNLLSINDIDINLYFNKVQKLYLADNNIEDITCFKQIKNLQSLSISKNCLTNLNGIQQLTKLYYLKFDENNIISLAPIRKLINLTYISGNINQINSLDGLQKLAHLGSLSLCQNKIKTIDELKYLNNLKRIYLRDNPIESIASLKDSIAKHLYIGNTNINVLQIAQLKSIGKLKQVSLKNMRLSHIPKIFDGVVRLQQLKLSKNNIKKIQNIENAVNLQRLDLSDNQIQVMQNLTTLQNLQVLNLKNNKIKVVSGVKSYIQSLKILQLQMNPLDDLSDYLMYQQKILQFMRLKFTEQTLSSKAKEQLRNHATDIGSKSQSD